MQISLKLLKYLLFFVPFAFLLQGYLVEGFNGLYGQDGHEYNRLANNFIEYFAGTTDHINKGRIPIVYSFFASVIAFVTGNTPLVLQLISFCSFLLIIHYSYKILHFFHPSEKESILVFLLITIASSSFFLKMSTLVMTDMFALLFVMGGYFHAFKYWKFKSDSQLYLSMLFIGLAFFVRYAAGVLLVIPFLINFGVALKHFKIKNLLVGILILAFFLIPFSMIGSGDGNIVQKTSTVKWAFANIFSNNFTSPNAGGAHQYSFSNIVFSLSNFIHPRFFLLSLPLLLFSTAEKINLLLFRSHFLIDKAKNVGIAKATTRLFNRSAGAEVYRKMAKKECRFIFAAVLRTATFKKKEIWVIFISVLLYVIFISGLRFQNTRYLMLALALWNIVLFFPFKKLWNKISNKSIKTIMILGIVLFQFSVGVKTIQKIYNISSLEKEVASFLVTQENKSIYAFDIDISFRSYKIPQKIYNLFMEKYQTFDKGALVIFNEQKFAKQWEDANPMFNWNKMNKENNLVKIKSFKDGWNLYEIN